MFSDSQEKNVIINADSLGKMYRIYNNPQERLKQLVWRSGHQLGKEFWALRKISFSIGKGESVGIIGQNGSGKSTLLQIIAGTLVPTEGEVTVNGRVGALLELGSGFNPEFSGRENVFLNGAILGLSYEDIEQRYEDIISFADIGDFINQPVKVYSSGMMVRLAFAVQAHIAPDVLIIDEALSVGDIYFQHKCMRRIKDLVKNGTTLLFVSHSTETIKRFCEKGLWLNNGRISYWGEAGICVEKYLSFMRMRESSNWLQQDDAIDEINADFALPTNRNEEILENYSIPFAFVEKEIDITLSSLFIKGEWNSSIFNNIVSKYTTDSNALIGFICQGTEIELDFVSSSVKSSINVIIDGFTRKIELFHPDEAKLERIRFDVKQGKHEVIITPDIESEDKSLGIHWVGGRCLSPRELKFREDSSFIKLNSEVERYGSQKGMITSVEFLDYITEKELNEVNFRQYVRLRIHAKLLEQITSRVEFSFIVRDRNRIDLFGTTTIDEKIRLDSLANTYVVEFSFCINLGPGSYSILVSFVECSEDLSFRIPMDQIDIAKIFTVPFEEHRPVWYIFHEPTTVNATCHYESNSPSALDQI